MTTALATLALGRRFGDTWALESCTLDVRAGAIVALVGPNGAGKSTLMRLVTGLLSPTAGSVEVFGRPPEASAGSLARIAFLDQDHPLYRSWTVAEHLHMGRSMNPTWHDELAVGHLRALGIPLDRRVGRLSGGQQAQVALTMALAKGADLLVLDEPVKSLDPLARREFMSLLLGHVAEHGTTVLLSSHVVAELERACDHLIVLADGHVQLAGQIDEVLDRHRILVGPKGASFDHLGIGVVIDRTDTGGTTSLIARTSGASFDPRWEASPISLEELVLAYLRNGSGRPAPTRHASLVGGAA